MPVVEARAKFLVEYAPVIASGAEPASGATRRRTSAGTVAALFAAYVAHQHKASPR